ncbi:hypothetical protein [Guptibacillus algicola]|uniref:hypothetical protein n=1 Tax=Guptibacillus algicola TaxID=225844 RepID=UPI001CD67E12|nr:hypothetical protein [Alkalihalobacillus algicola]MCA0987814.1 hypothetical protein [Alkalihalobacillus algicola]
MIFYSYNPEFDKQSLETLRDMNPSLSTSEPTKESIIYLLETNDTTIGYIWIEMMTNHAELIEFYFTGDEAKKWGLYDFVVKTSKKQGKTSLIMKVPSGGKQEEFIEKWGGEVRERREEESIVKIPFQLHRS